jgi:hypothetical protein
MKFYLTAALFFICINTAKASPCDSDSVSCYDAFSESWVTFENANTCVGKGQECGSWSYYGICVEHAQIETSVVSPQQ